MRRARNWETISQIKRGEKNQAWGQTPTNKPPTNTAVRATNAASARARGTIRPSGVTKSALTETGRAGFAGVFRRRGALKEG